MVPVGSSQRLAPPAPALVPRDHRAARRPLSLARAAAGRPDPRRRGGPATAPARSASFAWIPRPASANWFWTTRTSTSIQARGVFARPRPDGRSSVIALDDPLAEFYCMSVYQNDLANRSWLPKGSVKTLRVIEGLPRKRTGKDRGGPSAVPDLSPRRILAEVPVEKDGSFHLSVPANTPIQLQILDDQGLALRSCGWIWARNHQAQGCIGCHEDPELTPHQSRSRRAEARGLADGRPRRTPHRGRFRHRDLRRSSRRSAHPCHRAGRAGAGSSSVGRAADARLQAALRGRSSAGTKPPRRPGWASTFIPGGPAPVRSSGIWWAGTRPGPGTATRGRGTPRPIPLGKEPAAFRGREADHHPLDRSGSTLRRAAGSDTRRQNQGQADETCAALVCQSRHSGICLPAQARWAVADEPPVPVFTDVTDGGGHPLQAQLRRQGAEQHRRGHRRRGDVLRLRRRRLARHLPRHRPVSPRRQRQHGPPAQGQALQPALSQQPRRHLHRRDRQGGRGGRRGLRRGLLGRRLRRRRAY